MGNGVNILYRDLLTLGISRYLVYLGNKPAHELSADRYKPLCGAKLNALALGGKTLDDPFYQRIAELRRHMNLNAGLCKGLKQFEPFIRFKTCFTQKRDRAIIGDVAYRLHDIVSLFKLIEIHSANLDKTSFRQKRYGINSLGKSKCAEIALTYLAVAEIVRFVRHA